MARIPLVGMPLSGPQMLAMWAIGRELGPDSGLAEGLTKSDALQLRRALVWRIRSQGVTAG